MKIRSTIYWQSRHVSHKMIFVLPSGKQCFSKKFKFFQEILFTIFNSSYFTHFLTFKLINCFLNLLTQSLLGVKEFDYVFQLIRKN